MARTRARAARGSSVVRPVLDARPDTVDFRDLLYTPTLTEVPLRIPLEEYMEKEVPILDQGREGACTGFGLAAVVHFLLRTRKVDPDPVAVSPRMLYEMAKRYDEWPGDAYEGSSARGAMKGWHKHGVCEAAKWPYDPANPDRALTDERSSDAVNRPLGAYYRVNHKDLVAMHTALAEVGVLYATASVHEGWWEPPASGIIPLSDRMTGGHAFAIVAYDEEGFWIQNSWTDAWGRGGFGRVSYDDWLRNGSDVWVARLGVPVKLSLSSSVALVRSAGGGGRETYAVHDLRPHIIATGNDGRLRPEGTYGTNAQDLKHLFEEDFPRITAGWKKKRILLYAHGGLVDESSAVQRLSDYRPMLLEKEVYPLSFIWKSDLWTTITNILKDAFGKRRPEGLLDAAKDFLLDRLDDGLEPLARVLGGRAVWAEMKENALSATTSTEGGARLALEHLRKILDADPSIEIHLIGHSAGSIFLAPMAQAIATSGIIGTGSMKGQEGLGRRIRTATLWAPACTVELFKTDYAPLIVSGAEPGSRMGIGDFAVFALTDKAEQDDHCAGIYHKSLLYLVSNAIEERYRIPIIRPTGTELLGMETFSGKGSPLGRLVAKGKATLVLSPNQAPESSGEGSTSRSHGGFDDDQATVKSTLVRILGAKAGKAEFTFKRSASSMKDQRRVLGLQPR